MKEMKKIPFPILKGGSYKDLERLLADTLNLYAHGTMVSKFECDGMSYMIGFQDYAQKYNLCYEDVRHNLHKVKLYSMQIDKYLSTKRNKYTYLS